MRDWNKVHVYAGASIVLVVLIIGCCLLSLVGRAFGQPRPLYGPHIFNWTPWALASGLVGRMFGLVIAVIVIVAVVVFVLWVTGRISISWRKP